MSGRQKTHIDWTDQVRHRAHVKHLQESILSLKLDFGVDGSSPYRKCLACIHNACLMIMWRTAMGWYITDHILSALILLNFASSRWILLTRKCNKCEWYTRGFSVCPDSDWIFTGCSTCTPFWRETVLDLIFLCIRMITRYSRYPDIRPYGDPTGRNQFYLASSENPVSDVIPAQSLYRSARQYLQLNRGFSAYDFRWGSVISLCVYWTGMLTTYVEVWFALVLEHVVLLSKSLAVGIIRYTGNWLFSSRE